MRFVNKSSLKGLLDTISNGSPAGMIESPSSDRTVFNGNQSTNTYQKTSSSPEYTWCYESSIPNQMSNGTSFDECLPQLEIDDKPLTYRQQFEKLVRKEILRNDR